MRCYKLTDHNGQTKNNTQWGPGVVHTTSGEGELCGPGWLHAYEHPLLAVLLNPIHADFKQPRLWAATGSCAVKYDRELKLGYSQLETHQEIKLPILSKKFRARFAIKCALEEYKAPEFVKWATDWLSGKDRTVEAARVTARAARAAAWAAEAAARATARAARAAEAAARAAEAAARAAEAAEAAAWAAEAAARADKTAPKFLLRIALEVAAELGTIIDCGES